MCIMVLDYLSTTLQRYEKISRYASFSATFFALFRRKKGLLRVCEQALEWVNFCV